VNLLKNREEQIAQNNYRVKERSKEEVLKGPGQLFGDNPEPLRELLEHICQFRDRGYQILRG